MRPCIFIIPSIVILGCRFDPGGVPLDSGVDAAEVPDTAPPDAPSPSTFPHIPETIACNGAYAALVNPSIIDTSDLTVMVDDVAVDVVFDAYPEDAPNNEAQVAILRVESFKIDSDNSVRVTGSRPLVIIADKFVQFIGDMDASAHRDEPGPGGFGPGQGPGAGGPGTGILFHDSGGGGAGHATTGGKGGDAQCDNAYCTTTERGHGGRGGKAYASLPMLRGGSGGGAASPDCSAPAGAGGGAIHIYARRIVIGADAGINVGGGGGGGGVATCKESLNAGSGSGGGSGGVLVLQAESIRHTGKLAANGGGGGGSAGLNGDDQWTDGENGEDAKLSVDPAAGGDQDGDTYGHKGGAGGARGLAPQQGMHAEASESDGNGGGGGGAPGYIVLLTVNLVYDGETSPAPEIIFDPPTVEPCPQ